MSKQATRKTETAGRDAGAGGGEPTAGPARNMVPTPGLAGFTGGIDPLIEVKPGSEDIRRRAYERFLKRQASGLPGGPDDDWLEAERELNGRG